MSDTITRIYDKSSQQAWKIEVHVFKSTNAILCAFVSLIVNKTGG
jgi:hypothetical protein